jgi:DNA repair exonuclease SbcCD ATPase subunit/DNA repair exonuclease SbcCD nuclease subunit
MAAIHLSSKHITHIIHIADLHVRCGNNESARVEEYEAVFNRFLSDISDLPCVVNGTAVCVIAGDVFETKTRAETAGGIMLFSFINNLQKLIPIVIICGNHDFKQSEPDIPDSVDMITTPYKSATEVRVKYLKNTGRYIWGNIGFGLCSVKDTLRVHNTAGVVENLPAFPSPDDFLEEVKYKVALFHGTISQSALPTGRSADTVAYGYPLDWFAGYDAVMLGDNHQQQLHTSATGMHWGYPGSLVQQNFGEPLYGHGYILWDVANNKGTPHHVCNDYGAVTVVDDMVMLSPALKVTFKEATELSHFPKHPRVRIVGDQDDVKFTQAYFLKYAVVPSFITLKGRHSYNVGGGDEEQDTLGTQMNTLSDLNSPQYWEAFMNDQPNPIPVSEWIYQPSRMMLPTTYNVPTTIADALTVRNNKIQQLLQVHEKCANAPSSGKHCVVLKYMEWDNLMTFGVDNRFDFETIDNKIALLNGANATGKSSFLDVLCIAIYGEPTASRRDFSGTNISHKIINDHKALNASCGVTLVVSIDGTLFEIYRSFTSHSQDKDTIKTQVVAVYKYVDTAGEDFRSKEVVAEGNTMVNTWVSKYFGTSDEILMSTILCQSDTTNFFFKSHAEQRHILDKALHLDTISSYVEVLDESIKAHKYMVDKLQSYRQGMADSVDCEVPSDIEKLQAAADAAKTQAKELHAAKDELLSSIGDMKEIKQIAREYDDVICESIKAHELHLEKLGGSVDKGMIITARDKLVRLQVEHEEMLKTAVSLGIPQTEYLAAHKKDLTIAKKELSAHVHKKPMSISRFSREHISTKKTAYTEWRARVTIVTCDDVQDARHKLEKWKAAYDQITEQYHNIKGYNICQPSASVYIEASDREMSVKDAVQLYFSYGGSDRSPEHSSEYYENIIKTWKKTEWLANADVKLSELRKSESELNTALDKHMSDEEYISKPTVMRANVIADGNITRWTKAALLELQTAVVPCRPKSELSKWKKTLDEWQALAIPEESVEKLERSLEYIKMKSEIDELMKIECNPECHVCCKNPGVVRKKALEKKLAKLVKHEVVASGDRKTLERMLLVRRTYEDRVEWMTSEIAAWESASTDFELEDQRVETLAIAWWALWDTWDTKLRSLKTKRIEIRTEIEAIVDHTRVYTQKHAEYVDAVSNLVLADAYQKRMVAWNIVWHAVQRDLSKTKLELETLANEIAYLQEYIAWDDELAGMTEDEALLDAMDAWMARHTALQTRVAAEKWKQRWGGITVELAAARAEVAIYDERCSLENTICLYRRIIAYWQFEDLDDRLGDVQDTADTAIKMLDTAKANLERFKNKQEIERGVKTAYEDLHTRLETLIEFQRRFVGYVGHDGFKMWVYRTKVLPLIEQEVNRFIGYIDTFTLSIRIRKGNFIYMLHDRGSIPTLDHASGYQKFIVGLAMRVALARIGAVGQNIKHMFIDEGFVACDASNMLKTKDIMDLMLRLGGYNSILLITHLDAIKEIAQMRVDVCRPEGAHISYIRLGLRRKAVPKLKQTNELNATSVTMVKKRGRPSKAAIAASRVMMPLQS